jgi:hypothetical protein
MEMEAEEFQEADALWPWPDTPPPPLPEEDYSPATELYDERDASVVGFSFEPFSEPELASLSSASTSSALLSDRLSSGSSEDGFFLSSRSTVVSGLAGGSSEEFLEKDVLWPDDTAADEDTADFWCPCRRRVEEATAAAACGKSEGWRPLVSSPIDIPVPTRGPTARRRPSPLAVPLHRRW